MNRVRFTCLAGCTNCCRRPGFVYLTEADLARAAARLGLPPGDFEARYVYRTRHTLRLRKPRGSSCYFLAEGGCRLHPDKPTQCRLYPFWPELIGRPGAWRKESRVCPGIGRGRPLAAAAARRRAARMCKAYPFMYEE